jgi:predicted RNase H-like nuclease
VTAAPISQVVIAGADGCPHGWVVVREARPDGPIEWEVVSTLADLFQVGRAVDLLALDIPIGLPASGPRGCDEAARLRLGPQRRNSVFPAPIRPVLEAGSHAEACRISRSIQGKALSIQSWGIVPKIREADTLLRERPDLRGRVREVHPEVCFATMAKGKPMEFSKKSPQGRAERIAHLRGHFGNVVDEAMGGLRRPRCGADDLLDAFAGLWTARRIASRSSFTLPAEPPLDEFGLPMEIVA